MKYFNIPTLVFFIFFFFISLPGFNQEKQFTIPNNQVFKILSSSKSTYIKVNSLNSNILQILPINKIPYNSFYQDIMYYKGFIYVFLPSSGVLYKSSRLNKDDIELKFNRIDSTNLLKYNINCYSFISNDTIFNIGGYGFWRWNGHLRYFNSDYSDWDIIKLNQEFPIESDYKNPSIWYSYDKKLLVSLNYKYGNEGIIDNSKRDDYNLIDSVIKLNLINKKWESTGLLNPIVKDLIKKSYKICDLDSGILINSNGGNIYYLNFLNNNVFSLKQTSYKYLLTSKILDFPVLWVDKSNLYISKSLTDDSIIDININFNHFNRINQKIYLTTSNNIYYYIITTLILFSFLIYYLLINYKKKVRSLKFTKTFSVINNDIFFTEIEKKFINTLMDNLEKFNRKTSVDEINKILGIFNKSLDVQKRKRSDIINIINTKYSTLNNNTDLVLIKRAKTSTDRRMNEFYLNENELINVKKYLLDKNEG